MYIDFLHSLDKGSLACKLDVSSACLRRYKLRMKTKGELTELRKVLEVYSKFLGSMSSVHDDQKTIKPISSSLTLFQVGL